MAEVVGRDRAVAMLANVVRQQASVMSYSDCFILMGIGLVVSMLAIPLLSRPPSGQGGGGAH